MPRLETERLLLRPPETVDASAIAKWLGDFSVAKNMAMVPHPYTIEDAEAFVAGAADTLAKGEAYTFAILRKSAGDLIGCCTLTLKDGRYKLSIWIGKPFWNRGYATEAARKVVGFAYYSLRTDRVWASWFADNPAAGRMLEKLGAEPIGAYRRESTARGDFVISNRAVLRRETFGRKRMTLDRPDFLQAVGA